MLHITNPFRKKISEQDEAPQGQSNLQKNLLPICVGGLCLLLVFGIIIKTIFTHPKTAQNIQTYDRCATIAAVGDIALSAKQLRSFHPTNDAYDFSNCFRQVSQSISSADFAIANLEGTVTNDESMAESNVFPASFLSSVADCGFDLLQTANSYSIQNGIYSIETTMSAIEQRGMMSAGTFRSIGERTDTGGINIVEINDIRFAIIAFTKGLNNMHLPEGNEYAVNLLYHDYDSEYTSINETGILDCINQAKAASVDFIIAMVHWGSENDTQISSSQEQIADLLINNGVDVIIGSHSHIVGKIEHRYAQLPDGSWKDVYIAYSLGDFLTSSEQAKSQYGCILNLRFEKDTNSGFCAITDINYTPTYCTSPSKSLGTNSYAVIDSLNAIQLREEQYYDAISEALCNKLTQTLDALTEQTESDYQIKKSYIE